MCDLEPCAGARLAGVLQLGPVAWTYVGHCAEEAVQRVQASHLMLSYCCSDEAGLHASTDADIQRVPTQLKMWVTPCTQAGVQTGLPKDKEGLWSGALAHLSAGNPACSLSPSPTGLRPLSYLLAGGSRKVP